jgi:hypothetical protein
MWRKPEENKPQSALDALPSTVSAPQRPAAAAPVSSNAPACVIQGIKIKGEVSGREDLVLDGELEGKIQPCRWHFQRRSQRPHQRRNRSQ